MTTIHKVQMSNKWKNILEKVCNAGNKSNMVNKLGSALIYKGRIIKTGYNHNDRSQWHGITVPSIHAEMHVTHFLSPYNKPVNYRNL